MIMYGIKGQKKIILYDQECQPTKSNLKFTKSNKVTRVKAKEIYTIKLYNKKCKNIIQH